MVNTVEQNNDSFVFLLTGNGDAEYCWQNQINNLVNIWKEILVAYSACSNILVIKTACNMISVQTVSPVEVLLYTGTAA